ncbi:type I secretion system permease/ATPase [Teichococcus vastitatis]|uniref:Type I secretion system permease/ATPase n=1 Tax=Teichococcus vastitatis TaxID=2307076 RepID=A0ABS9W5J1_9PROT|nr:type I secretion system permease/ATPase [Pseudoroseomonas vastitatis]MCI0753864.1 type I secretion system permease/ATPase [Pseudoroseomonas vastitatis]
MAPIDAMKLKPQAVTELDRAVAACRSTVGVLGLFSLVINLLMLAPSLYMLQVYDRVMTTGSVETLVMLTLMVALALFAMGFLDALRAAITVRMGCWLSGRLGPAYLANGVRMRLISESAGAQPLRDLATVQGFVASPGVHVFFDAPWSPLFLVLIWMLHPWLGTLAVASSILLLGFGVANEYLTRSSAMTSSVAQIDAMQLAEATIRNAEVVKAMGMLPALLARWHDSNATGLAAQQRAGERGSLLLGITKSLRYFVQSATLGLGAYLVLQGQLSGGTMIAASILLGRTLAPVEAAMGTWKSFGMARIAYGRLKGQLRTLSQEPVRTRLPEPKGVLTLSNVSFVPPGGRVPVLRGISFEATPGEVMAVIGPSAGGKSTLCRLLVGTADPTAGEVRLDGADLRHWNPEDLGRHVGYLPQDVELFSGTVRDNIARMGHADDEAVIEAALRAHAHALIQQLPQGYDTVIGDGGIRLSGGQRQRIGLARAVYGLPRLIVLDEPNANLDTAGEAALAAAIHELKQHGCTLLIVGHRPSTIAQADRILLLKEGRVELIGPRDEVLKRLRKASSSKADAAQQDEAQSA